MQQTFPNLTYLVFEIIFFLLKHFFGGKANRFRASNSSNKIWKLNAIEWRYTLNSSVLLENLEVNRRIIAPDSFTRQLLKVQILAWNYDCIRIGYWFNCIAFILCIHSVYSFKLSGSMICPSLNSPLLCYTFMSSACPRLFTDWLSRQEV